MIALANTRNVRSFLAWYFKRGEVVTPPGCLVGKGLDVLLDFKLCNTVVIALFVSYFIIMLFFPSWTSIILAF